MTEITHRYVSQLLRKLDDPAVTARWERLVFGRKSKVSRIAEQFERVAVEAGYAVDKDAFASLLMAAVHAANVSLVNIDLSKTIPQRF